MDDIEGKLDIMIEMLFEERQRNVVAETESWKGSQHDLSPHITAKRHVSGELRKSPSIPTNFKSDLQTSPKKISFASELLAKRKASCFSSINLHNIVDDEAGKTTKTNCSTIAIPIPHAKSTTELAIEAIEHS